MNLNDPKLTAFALDELDEPERSTIACAVADSPEAQRYIDETSELVRSLKSEFAAELANDTATSRSGGFPAADQIKRRSGDRRSLSSIRDDPWFWSIARPLGIAAVIAVAALAASVLVFSLRHENRRPAVSASQPTEVEAEIVAANEAESSADAGDRFVDATANPVSTFPLNVGTSSYPNIRAAILRGSLPSLEAVQIEEMINFFAYDYVEPTADKLFAIDLEGARCPWEPAHQLVRIGITRREGAMAKAGNVEVQFNPARAASYRLIGYEKRTARKTDLNQEVAATPMDNRRIMTALFEVVPTNMERSTSSSGEMLTVKLRYKNPDGDKSELIERAVTDSNAAFANASPDFKFAAAVAEFGMLLRDSEHKGNGTFGAVLEWANEGKGADTNGYRAGFIDLVRKTRALKKG